MTSFWMLLASIFLINLSNFCFIVMSVSPTMLSWRFSGQLKEFRTPWEEGTHSWSTRSGNVPGFFWFHLGRLMGEHRWPLRLTVGYKKTEGQERWWASKSDGSSSGVLWWVILQDYSADTSFTEANPQAHPWKNSKCLGQLGQAIWFRPTCWKSLLIMRKTSNHDHHYNLLSINCCQAQC